MRPYVAGLTAAFACLAVGAALVGPAAATDHIEPSGGTPAAPRTSKSPTGTATRTATDKIAVTVSIGGTHVVLSYRSSGRTASKHAKLRSGRWAATLPGTASAIKFRYSKAGQTSRWVSVKTPPKTVRTQTGAVEDQQFAFIAGTRAAPVRWHTCAPLTWRTTGEALTELPRLRTALDQVSAATGISFVYSESPEAMVTVDLRWVANSSVSGSTTMSWSTNSFQLPRLNPATVHLLVGSQSSAAMRSKLYLHELGHVMGLTHVASRAEIMSDSWNPGVTTFGPGDLNGLARLGVPAGCLLPPPAPTGVRLAAADAGLTLSWQQPQSSAPVIQTTIQAKTTCSDGSQCWIPIGSAGAASTTTLTLMHSQCTAGRSYRITASNAYGDSTTTFQPMDCP
ncbi:MAG: hypothetical protein WCI74_00440 [Actinomycetes bacterium]